jgi:hypothetical protein
VILPEAIMLGALPDIASPSPTKEATTTVLVCEFMVAPSNEAQPAK